MPRDSLRAKALRHIQGVMRQGQAYWAPMLFIAAQR